jgi:hypothetical protein
MQDLLVGWLVMDTWPAVVDIIRHSHLDIMFMTVFTNVKTHFNHGSVHISTWPILDNVI